LVIDSFPLQFIMLDIENLRGKLISFSNANSLVTDLGCIAHKIEVAFVRDDYRNNSVLVATIEEMGFVEGLFGRLKQHASEAAGKFCESTTAVLLLMTVNGNLEVEIKQKSGILWGAFEDARATLEQLNSCLYVLGYIFQSADYDKNGELSDQVLACPF
jgi:hypothetical protein